MKKIILLALPNCLQSSITGFYDILSVANRLAARDMGTAPIFHPVIASPDGGSVPCFTGMALMPECSLAACGPADILYLPVIYGDLGPILSDRPLINAIDSRIQGSSLVAAVCAGVFVLAQTNALDGREATTHWNLARNFSDRYPKVKLKPEKMLVDEGNLITAGGVTAYMDLALYLISRFGSRELSALVSKSLLIDPVRPTQAPYTGLRPNRSHGDDPILTLQDWMETRYRDPLTLSVLADRAGLGERTLARRFKKATGDTPLEYLQHLRLGAARTLLETTARPVDQITWEVGYQDVSSFRRLFKQRTGLSPSAYRKRFGAGF